MPPSAGKTRARQVLLLSNFSHPHRDLVAMTLGWMCKAKGIGFDAYYATSDGDIAEGGGGHHESHQGGALFSIHGSMVLGGRHQQAVARALATFSTAVVVLGEVHIFRQLVDSAATSIVRIGDDLIEGYQAVAGLIGAKLPNTAVAFQTRDLPAGLLYGVTQYAFPEATYRQALALPLEMPAKEVDRLPTTGVTKVHTIAAAKSDVSAWKRPGIELSVADALRADDTYMSFTFRIAERWSENASGYDLCEPVLAAHWLPFDVREDRLQVCGEVMTETAERLAPMVKAKGDHVVYGRYAGGRICGAVDDEDLFAFFRNDITYQVIEPRRPVLRVLSSHPEPRQVDAAATELHAPSDEQLRTWADKGRILTSLVFHSGELSHDDAMTNVMDLCALTKVKIGMPVHVQRYLFDPDCVEPMYIPTNEGGVQGMCEPILHSGGFGIIAESLGEPRKIASLIAKARDQIASIVGEEGAPKGVYCYMDALPTNWQARPEQLWQSIADAGFEYVISSVSPGPNRILFRSGDFVALNLGGFSYYPYSPFMRVNSAAQMVAIERRLAVSGTPGWNVGVIDSPIFAYSSYLNMGESLPSIREPAHPGSRLGKFFEYVRGRGEMHSVISATPGTIARYARLISERI